MLIREAEFADARAIARVHVRSWQQSYAGLLPAAYLNSLTPESREQMWRDILSTYKETNFVYVAENDDREIVGFASGGAERGGHPDYEGELYAIYLLDAYKRQGIGQQLVLIVADRLRQHGMGSMVVWVLAENPARAFYEALGGNLVGEQEITLAGTMLIEVAYGWSDLNLLTASELPIKIR